MSNIKRWESDGLLLLTAGIWGFAFVAQRVGMQYVGPFIFNAIRFALGSSLLVPFLLVKDKTQPIKFIDHLLPGLFAGIVLFVASSLQQIGIIYTTAGKAGFITGLYVVLVPILGLLWRQRVDLTSWIGVLLAAGGLYFLSITGTLTISRGDFLVLLSAFFWAGHVHIIGHFSPKSASKKLAFIQFLTCSLLSFVFAFLFEDISRRAILQASLPIMYGGFLSVGVAYSLQVVAQKHALPTHTAIILSLEAVFAVLGGWLLLSETLSKRHLFGCLLMLAGMLVSQIEYVRKNSITDPISAQKRE